MNDEQKQPNLDPEESPEESASFIDPEITLDDIYAPDFPDLDIDAALAAIGDLTILTEDETSTTDEGILDDDEVPADDDHQQEVITHDELPVFISPPLSTLKRGQMASVLPAFTLIIIGLALTYATFTGVDFDTSLLPVLGMGGLGVMALAHWVSSRRWAQGSLLIGLLLISSAIASYIWQQPDNLPMWYILPGAWAIAFFLTGILGHTHNSRLLFISVCFVIVTLSSWLITGDILSPELVATFANLAPVALVIVILLILVPARRT